MGAQYSPYCLFKKLFFAIISKITKMQISKFSVAGQFFSVFYFGPDNLATILAHPVFAKSIFPYNNFHEGLVINSTCTNCLMHNVQKWSDTLSKSCSKCCKNFKVCLTILGHYPLKG